MIINLKINKSGMNSSELINRFNDVASCNKFPIIKEILKGMQFNKIKFIDGLDLVKKLGFNDENEFIQVFDQVFQENISLEYDPDLLVIDESCRISFCIFFANLYTHAVQSDSFKFLRLVANRCDEVIYDWIHPQKNITDAIYSINLQSVGLFLEHCVQDYKTYDQTMFTMIYQDLLLFVQNANQNICSKRPAFQIINICRQLEQSRQSSFDHKAKFHVKRCNNFKNFSNKIRK